MTEEKSGVRCCLFPITYIRFILGWRNRLRHLQTQAWHKPVHHTVEQQPKCQECASHCANIPWATPKCCFAKKEALSSTWMLLDSPRGLAFSIQRDPTERFRRRRQNCGADNTKHFTKNISSNKVTVSAVELGFSGVIYFYPESCGRTWLTVPRAQHQGAVWPAEGRSALSRSPHWNRASKEAAWTSAAYLTRWFVSLVCI